MDRSHLEAILRRIDGRGYKAYQDLGGRYDFPTFTLLLDQVQRDPFAPPSLLRARTPQRRGAFPPDLFSTPTRRIALEDCITRQFAAAVRRLSRSRGTGGSGRVLVDVGGQEVLERTSCVVTQGYVEVRLAVGMPAEGRRVLGGECQELLCDALPQAVEYALLFSSYQPARVQRHIQVVEDQEHLRAQLLERHLVAFVANGSILPRESGASDRPLTGEGVIPFQSPPELEVTLPCPHRGQVQGMGIPEGVTIVVGGGYHGKSTLLQAVARSVYNHVPGDGREYVVTRGDAVKVRAEEGRRVEGVDISAFISNLPFGQDTSAFRTENASGSTSQAVNIVEAVEAGTSLLLMDEDTCATNFMLRDSRMQRLVPKALEPITPLVDRVRHLYHRLGVSTILVMGGSSDYLEVADTVIGMDHFRPQDLTARARELVDQHPTHRLPEAAEEFRGIVHRAPLPESLSPYRPSSSSGHRQGRVRAVARGLKVIQFGDERIDLSALEQLVDGSQTAAIADLLVYCLRQGYVDGRASLRQVLTQAFGDLRSHGLDVISPFANQHPGDYAWPRPQEVAGALNRLRSLRVRQLQEER